MPVGDLLRLLWETLPLYARRSDLLVVVGVVLLLAYSQYRRIAAMERRLLGFVKNRPLVQLGRAVAGGLLGGLLATLVFVGLGISLAEVGVWYLWALAVGLMFVHPRFLCFSYGGGLLALAHLLTGVPRIDVPALMALVAVLHLVEATLIYAGGAGGATPVYVRRPGGRVVGGFTLQKVWPLPFVALVGALVAPEMLRDAAGVDMPAWWPVFRPREAALPGLEYAYALFPVVAALGYSDIALTSPPAVKARRTAASLLAYSAGLLALAVLAQQHVAFAFAAALYSPLAHEWVIYRARAREERGEPCFTGPEPMVLDVHPDSPAARLGLAAGDVIRAVNDIPVRTREELSAAMEPWALGATIEVENAFTGRRRTVRCTERVPPLGVLLVPEPHTAPHLEMATESLWAQVLRRFRRKWTAT